MSNLTEQAKQKIVNKAKRDARLHKSQAKLQSKAKMSAPVVSYTDEQIQRDKIRKLDQYFGKIFDEVRKNNKRPLSFSTKVMGSTTDTAGGFGVPDEFHQLLIQKARTAGTVAGVVQRRPTTRDTVNVTIGDAKPRVSKQASQGAAITKTDASYRQEILKVFDNFIATDVNNQLMEDWALQPGFSEQLVQDFADGLADQEEMEVVIGTGDANQQALGISDLLKKTGGLTQFVSDTGTTAGEFDESNMLKLFHKLPAAYRSRGVFLINDEHMPNIYDAGNQNTNRYFVPVSVGGPSVPGSVGTFMGRPVLTTTHISKILDVDGVAANKASAVIFFDPRYYMLLDRMGASIETSPHEKFSNYQTVFRGVKRFGGRWLLKDAFAALYFRGTT